MIMRNNEKKETSGKEQVREEGLAPAFNPTNGGGKPLFLTCSSNKIIRKVT